MGILPAYKPSLGVPQRSMDKADQRRLEREKRQARIRASGSNRLAKITGVAGTQDFKGPVDVAEKQEPVASVTRSESNTVSPPVSSGDVTTSESSNRSSPVPSSVSPAPMTTPTLNEDDPLLKFSKQQNDPLFSMLANLTGESHQNPSRPPPSNSHGPDPTPAQMQNMAQAHDRSVSKTKAEYLWNFIYFVISAVIGIYAAIVNPWATTKMLVAVQVALLGIRSTLGHHTTGIPMISTFAPFLAMLPANRQRQSNLAGTVSGASRLAYWNVAVVVFFYGLASRGGAEFARPI